MCQFNPMSLGNIPSVVSVYHLVPGIQKHLIQVEMFPDAVDTHHRVEYELSAVGVSPVQHLTPCPLTWHRPVWGLELTTDPFLFSRYMMKFPYIDRTRIAVFGKVSSRCPLWLDVKWIQRPVCLCLMHITYYGCRCCWTEFIPGV